MKKSYDEIIQLDDRTRRDVVNAVLIFIIETHEAPHLLVKFKLLATSGDSNEHSKSCMKVQTTQVERVCHTTFQLFSLASESAIKRVPLEKATRRIGKFT
jgi:hypothetical protein